MKLKYITLAALLATSINSAYAHSVATVLLENQSNQKIGQTLMENKIFILKYRTDTFPTGKIDPQMSWPFHVLDKNLSEETLEFSLNFYENAVSGGKKCNFETSNNMTLNPDGSRSYNWTKSATGTNGAICTATIESTDAATGSWYIRFTMQ